MTCKAFRDISWQALAEVMGDTIFDLGSMTNFANLESISNEKALAPWIAKLTLVCYPRKQLRHYRFLGPLLETIARF